jgi:hypothetical protein
MNWPLGVSIDVSGDGECTPRGLTIPQKQTISLVSSFTIGVSGENALYGAFHQEKPHLSMAGWGTVIVKML